MSTSNSERIITNGSEEWVFLSWLGECQLCGGEPQIRIKNSVDEFYDGQDVSCLEPDCPAEGNLVVDGENAPHVNWHDMIYENGKWISNPEWDEFEQGYLLKD